MSEQAPAPSEDTPTTTGTASTPDKPAKASTRIEPVWTNSATEPESPTPKETFSREYVAELRAESEAWRKRHKHATDQLEKVKHETQTRLTQTQQATHERIIRAELKALALKAGLKDLDGLKLADLSKVTLKDDDTLEGATEMLAALKEAKPYLFDESKHSSPPVTPPSPKDPAPIDVSRLPPDEYERYKAAYLLRTSS